MLFVCGVKVMFVSQGDCESQGSEDGVSEANDSEAGEGRGGDGRRGGSEAGVKRGRG